MANDLVVPQNMGPLPTVFNAQASEDNDELAGGIVGGFAVLKYKGKVWSLQYKSTRDNLVDDVGNAVPSVEVVIIKSNAHLSKIYYRDGYQDQGSEGKRPDCWSSNGAVPDADVAQPVNPVCASCPMNVFGSRVTEAGKRGKQCSDHKRVVIAPLQDIENEYYGGPMLLRIPAASLGDVQSYSQELKRMGYPYYAVGTRIRFDINEAYPKLVFGAIRALDENEAQLILALRDDPRTLRILNTEPEAMAEGQEPEAPVMQFEQPPAAPPQAAAPRPAAPRPAAAPAPAAPAPQAAAPRQAVAPAPQAVKPSVQAPPARPATPAPAAPATPFRGAPRPAQAAPVGQRPAGGFASRPAAAPAAQTQAPTTINAAVAQPAARPPTQRPLVRPAAAQAPAPVTTESNGAEEAQYEETQEGGDLPPELDAQLDALLT